MAGSIDPETVLFALPKPGGREAVLLRRLAGRAAPRLEITLARAEPGGRYHALRAIGIGPDLLMRFAEAAPAAVEAVLAAEGASAPADPETAPKGPRTGGDER